MWLERHTAEFLGSLICLEVLLWTSALAVALNTSQIHILRPHPGLWPHSLLGLPDCLLTPPAVFLSVCRQSSFSVGNSDHYTVLKILRNVTKRLITARSSFRGWLFPASDLSALPFPSSAATQTTGSLFWDVACPPRTFSWSLGYFLVFSFDSASPLGTVSLQCTST